MNRQYLRALAQQQAIEQTSQMRRTRQIQQAATSGTVQLGQRDPDRGSTAASYANGGSTGANLLFNGSYAYNSVLSATQAIGSRLNLDARSSVKPLPLEEEPELKGKIKYLCSVSEDGEQVFYAFGWQKTPKRVHSFPLGAVIQHASIDNLGGDRWSANFCYRQGSTIFVQLVTPSGVDWTVTVPAVPVCLGHGFWKQDFLVEPEQVTQNESIQTSDPVFDPIGLGSTVITNRVFRIKRRVPRSRFQVWQDKLSTSQQGELMYTWNFSDWYQNDSGIITHKRLTSTEVESDSETIWLLPQKEVNQSFRRERKRHIFADTILVQRRNIYWREVASYSYSDSDTTTIAGQTYSVLKIDSKGLHGVGSHSVVADDQQTEKACWFTLEKISEHPLQALGQWIDVQEQSFTTLSPADAQFSKSKPVASVSITAYTSKFERIKEQKFQVFVPKKLVTTPTYTLFNGSYHT